MASTRKNLMKTDVRETEDTYEVDVDLPGFKKDEINVELKDGYLTISAAKGLDKDEQDKKGRVHPPGALCRRLQPQLLCGRDVEPEEVSAKYEDGILKLSMPKQAKKELPKQTSINIL